VIGPPSSACLKLARADEHIAAVKEYADRWLGTDAYTVIREEDPQTGHTVRRAQIKVAPPERISILAGDAIQNLRSALDHIVYALADRHLTLTPEIEAGLMFPIIGNVNEQGKARSGAKAFKDSIPRRLAGVPANALTFIESVQPYFRDKTGTEFAYDSLWRLAELSRVDKHRRLALVSAWLVNQYVSIPEGSVAEDIDFVHPQGPVEDGDVLVTYAGADEGVDAHFTRGVALNEGSFPGAEIVSDLKSLQGRVEWVVGVLERFL
jgi:hypothetical protein